MPGFDREIAKLAQRVLINPRSIDYHTGVLASKVIPGVGPAHGQLVVCMRPFTAQLACHCACISSGREASRRAGSRSRLNLVAGKLILNHLSDPEPAPNHLALC